MLQSEYITATYNIVYALTEHLAIITILPEFFYSILPDWDRKKIILQWLNFYLA